MQCFTQSCHCLCTNATYDRHSLINMLMVRFHVNEWRNVKNVKCSCESLRYGAKNLPVFARKVESLVDFQRQCHRLQQWKDWREASHQIFSFLLFTFSSLPTLWKVRYLSDISATTTISSEECIATIKKKLNLCLILIGRKRKHNRGSRREIVQFIQVSMQNLALLQVSSFFKEKCNIRYQI